MDTNRWFDIQINGYAGADFNSGDLDAETLHKACRMLADDGVEHILATIITEKVDVMCRYLENIGEIRKKDSLVRDVISGFHIEGPFISPLDGYRGAHPEDAVLPADVEVMKRLADSCDGLCRLVTLAPEADPGARLVSWCTKNGITTSAGHTNANLDELNAALDGGLSFFTHLGNGCPAVLPRHDNIIQRALSLDGFRAYGFIADGAHIPFNVLGNYLKICGLDRAVLVSDAIAPAALGPGHYTLGRWKLEIGDDMVARAPDGSHLVGSAISMKRGVENLRRNLGLTAGQADIMARDNPRNLLGLR